MGINKRWLLKCMFFFFLREIQQNSTVMEVQTCCRGVTDTHRRSLVSPVFTVSVITLDLTHSKNYMKRNESVICHQGVSIAAYDHTASNEFSRHHRLPDAQSPS